MRTLVRACLALLVLLSLPACEAIAHGLERATQNHPRKDDEIVVSPGVGGDLFPLR
jgi:hypothetical protein